MEKYSVGLTFLWGAAGIIVPIIAFTLFMVLITNTDFLCDVAGIAVGGGVTGNATSSACKLFTPGPGTAEASIPPQPQQQPSSTSQGSSLGTRNDTERYLYANGFRLKDATVDVDHLDSNFVANLSGLRNLAFGSKSLYGPLEITSGTDSHETGAHVSGNAIDISVNRGSGATFWNALN